MNQLHKTKGLIQVDKSIMYIILLFTLIISIPSIAQNLKSADNDEVLPIENIHLQLNKTNYLVGERIWFSAYVLDQLSKKPSNSTTHLHVDIYDKSGNRLKRKSVLVSNATASGNFIIDTDYNQRTYYIVAYTKWMLNFKELKPFVQQINILDQTDIDQAENPHIVVQFSKDYLLQNEFNSLGISIDGLGDRKIDRSSIALIDSEENFVNRNIELNNENLGKVILKPVLGIQYSFTFKLIDGQVIRVPLPPSIENGLDLQLNPLHPELIYGTVINNYKNDAIYLNVNSALEKDKKIELTSKEIQLNFDKRELPYGVNEIVLKNKEGELLESRKVFNQRGAEQTFVNLDYSYELNRRKDSMIITLRLKIPSVEGYTLSASVLPIETESYNPNNSIMSSFYLYQFLSPNIIGTAETLKSFERKEYFNIDLLLLNSKKPFFNPEKRSEISGVEFPFEHGFPIKGRINDADLENEKQIYAFGALNKTAFFANLANDKTFREQAILFEGDSLRISLMDSKGKLRKAIVEFEFDKKNPDQDYPQISQYLYHSNSDNVEVAENLKILELRRREKSEWNDSFDLEVPIELEEIILLEKKTMNVDIKLNSAAVTGKKISSDDIEQRVLLTSYLVTLGFKPRIIGGKVIIFSKTHKPGTSGPAPVPTFINGMYSDGYELLGMPLSRVSSVFYDNGGYDFLYIYLRPGHYSDSSQKNYTSLFVENGFSRNIDYINPNYSSLNTETFNKVAAIAWEDGLKLKEDRPATISVPISKQKSFKLFVEGMGSDGSLISSSKTIELNENQ